MGSQHKLRGVPLFKTPRADKAHTQQAEYMKAYRAAKQADKLAQAAKGQASVQSMFELLVFS